MRGLVSCQEFCKLGVIEASSPPSSSSSRLACLRLACSRPPSISPHLRLPRPSTPSPPIRSTRLTTTTRAMTTPSAPPSSDPQSFAANDPPLLRSFLGEIVKPYLKKNPTAVAALDLIRAHDACPLCYDHFAFRTFGVDGCGIDSIAQIFLDMGYESCEELRFPAKKLRALWFAPPDRFCESKGHELNGPLPRIFISELLVNQLSSNAQEVILKYTKHGAHISKHAALASMLNTLTWPMPSLNDYEILARESEYAAWTLVNGYALNHLTVSVHRLSSDLCRIPRLNEFLQSHGIRLNSEGGVLKVSPDGGLQQSSTVADTQSFTFAGNEEKLVPASYIEFAERLVLPHYAGLPASKVREWHRRDGFEVGNADKIFESTSSDQIGMR